MNNLISKIVGVCLGLSLATGVAVGVGAGNQEIREARATVAPASSISVGDTVFLVCSDASKQLSSISTTSTKYGIGTAYSNDPSTSVFPLTVESGSSSNTFAFKNGNNYLYWTSGNSLATNGTKTANTSWNVSFDANNNATITNSADSTRRIWWNIGSPRFACYTAQAAGSSYYSVQLFKESTAPSSVLTTISVTGTATATKDSAWNFSGLTVTGYDQNGDSLGVVTSNCVITSSASTATPGETTISIHVNYNSGEKEFDITGVSAIIYNYVTATFVAGEDKGETSVTKNSITVSMSTMSRDDNYRVYASSNLVVSSTNDIKRIELTCTGSGTADYGPGKLSGSGYTYSGYVGTWSGSQKTVTLAASAQARITQIVVTFETITTPSMSVDKDNVIVPLNSTEDIELTYANLSNAFSVSSSDLNEDYVMVSYTGASGTGKATIEIAGLEVTSSSVTLTISATGVDSILVSVSVVELPVIDTSLNSLAWGSTTYATSPHELTMSTSYKWAVSAGQLNSSVGYIGTNSNNSAKTSVNADGCGLNSANFSTIKSAVQNSNGWLAHGSAFRMLNFGVEKPKSIQLTIGNLSADLKKDTTTVNYFLLASDDNGDSWSVLKTNSLTEGAVITWSGQDYASSSELIQFAFAMTNSVVGTASNISVVVYGSSIDVTKNLVSLAISGTPVTTYVVGQPFDVGSAVVTATYDDNSTKDVTSSVVWAEIKHGDTKATGSFGGLTVEVNITVTDQGDIYKKVTNTNELLSGTKVVIGSSSGTYLVGSQKPNNRGAVEASGSQGYYDSGDTVTYSVQTAAFTIEVIETGIYAFKDSDNNYLYANGNGGNNYLRTGSTLNDYSKFSISFNNGVATIVGQGDNTNKYLNYNSSSTLFSAYPAVDSHDNPIVIDLALFADVTSTVQAFVSQYMHTDIEYNSDPTLPVNNTGNCNSQGWYLTAKRVMVGLGQDYSIEFTTNSSFANAYARYLAWSYACGDSTPFAGDNIVPASRTFEINTIDSDMITVVIIVLSITSATAIGAYFFLRKKKEVK